MNVRNIENIINHINSIKSGKSEKKGVCILLGAGADISSGGILFKELKIRFLEENGYRIPLNISDVILNARFEECLENLSQNDRCETLEKVMERSSKPSEGYELMVLLAQLGYIDAVLTTNFDYLLEETESLLNIKPFSIYAPGMAIPEEFYARRTATMPIYLKMHGDLYGRIVTHLTQTEIESKKYGIDFIKLFKHIIKNNTIITIGYGGYDELITQIFVQEMQEIEPVYWCNIKTPDMESKLAKALEENNKLLYVKTTFDKLFQNLAFYFLQEENMIDSNPIFLPTIFQSKMERQKKLFAKKLEVSTNSIDRISIKNKLDTYFQNYDKKCVVIKGEPQIGKSTFIYKSVMVIPDIKIIPISYNGNKGILETMAIAMGYKTDVPFSLMYNFSNWCNEKKEHIVFVIDDFFNDNYVTDTNYKYILELCNFIYVTSNHRYIQFLICFQEKEYMKFKTRKSFKEYEALFSNYIDIKSFSDIEVDKLLKKADISKDYISSSMYKLLHKPYIWKIINKSNQSCFTRTDKEFFQLYFDELYIANVDSVQFTKHSLYNTIKYLAYCQIFEADKLIDTAKEEVQFLFKEGIIDSNGKHIYIEIALYFAAEFLLGTGELSDIIENTVISSLKNDKKISDLQLEVFIVILSRIKTINDIQQVFGLLENILSAKKSVLATKLTMLTLTNILKTNEILFKEYLNSIDISIYIQKLQYCIFKLCTEFDKSMSLLSNSQLNEELAYNVFVYSNDFLYQKLLQYSQEESFGEILEMHFQKKSIENVSLAALHLLSYFGWDNVKQYERIKAAFKHKIVPYISGLTIENVTSMVEILKKYSYNIFFNAGQDFEENFIHVLHDERIKELIRNVLNGECLEVHEYKYLFQASIDYNNSWIFIIANIIVVQSMHNNVEKTCITLREMLNSFGDEIKVQQLDFYLSSVFWSLYLNKPYDRTCFVDFFRDVTDKYERLLFSFPEGGRYSSIRKFNQEVTWIFEDGFNPIAFYFYTAPFESTIQCQSDKRCVEDPLKIYWELAQNINQTGQYRDILRIVHALGQMISIYPEEGYFALEKLAIYNHQVIKEGVIRILKENYMRYSRITQDYIEHTKFQLDGFERDEVIFCTDLLLQNRTFEQLHWSRLFYNINEILHVNVPELFLSNILSCNSCNGFLKSIISDIFKI